jgi:hypothetical protein
MATGRNAPGILFVKECSKPLEMVFVFLYSDVDHNTQKALSPYMHAVMRMCPRAIVLQRGIVLDVLCTEQYQLIKMVDENARREHMYSIWCMTT